MNIKSFISSLALFVFTSPSIAEVRNVQKLTLDYSHIAPSKLFQVSNPGFGSGITLDSTQTSQETIIYMLTDRGPNIDGRKIRDNSGNERESIIFPNPDFSPLIAKVRIRSNSAEVLSVLHLSSKEGKRLSGIPPQTSETEQALPFDSDENALPTDSNGIDPEGIALSRDGNFWICEEYGPSLMHVDSKTGRILERIRPGDGLEQVIGARQINRGFEGIAVDDNGNVVTAIQSTLDVDGQTKDKAAFIRILRINPRTKAVQTFAYPISEYPNDRRAEVKIGDLTYVAPNAFLALENIKGNKETRRSRVMLLDFSQATDISKLEWNGKALEFGGDSVFGATISPIMKTQLVDLKKQGWNFKKTEGLALMPDRRTILVANDNDFAVEKTTKKKASKNVERTELWLLTLAQPLG